MSHLPVSAEARFGAIVEAFHNNPEVDPPSAGTKGFGSSGLRVHKKNFAMLVRDRLVVKLPKARVDALVDSGDGERFDPRHDGRLMKEWLVVSSTSELDWLSLAKEALAFVAIAK